MRRNFGDRRCSIREITGTREPDRRVDRVRLLPLREESLPFPLHFHVGVKIDIHFVDRLMTKHRAITVRSTACCKRTVNDYSLLFPAFFALAHRAFIYAALLALAAGLIFLPLLNRLGLLRLDHHPILEVVLGPRHPPDAASEQVEEVRKIHGRRLCFFIPAVWQQTRRTPTPSTSAYGTDVLPVQLFGCIGAFNEWVMPDASPIRASPKSWEAGCHPWFAGEATGSGRRAA